MSKLCDVDEVRKCLDEVTGDDSIYAKGLLEWAIKKRTIDEADIRVDERRKFAEWLQENVIIDAESGVTVVAGVEYTRVISFIELLEMYEKELKENEKE